MNPTGSAPFPLRCPVCEAPLLPNPNGLACPANHSFDRAREGYVNLLLSHQRKSKQAGDSPEMIQARRAFLDDGHYDPLMHALIEMVSPLNPEVILDAGCGTGHMLAALAAETKSHACGIDISKPAIKAAARAFPAHEWATANFMRDLPVQADSVDLLLNIMSPREVEAFARVLKPDGKLLMVVPGPGHLQQLRERLLDRAAEEADKGTRAIDACASHFTLEQQRDIRFELTLAPPQISALIGMTPLAWKSNPAKQAAVSALDELQVEAQFTLLLFTQRLSTNGD